MRPPVPHVRLKYLIPLTVVTLFLTGSYLVWTSNYDAKYIGTVTVIPKAFATEKYLGSLSRGHEKKTEIFGKLGKIKKQYIETEYQTKPPKDFIDVEEHERMRKLFARHRRMQKELEKRKEIFRHLRKEIVSTKSTPRELLTKLHYHVDKGTQYSGSTNLKSRHGGAIKLSYQKETRPDYCDGCMDLDIPYMIHPKNLCSHNPSHIEALVLIFSEPGHEQIREAIRETWGSLAKRNRGPIRIAFLFGQIADDSAWRQIRRESIEYKDILVGDFVDSFRNLTIKTIMGLKWAVNYCPSARYLAKTDDDMWLNLPKFLSVEKTLNLKNVVTGTCYDEHWHPHRDPESKYFVSYSEYPGEEYPLLCTGTAYIMSMRVATRIAEIQPNIPYFHLEDVYVALCRQRLGIGVLPLHGCFNYKEIFEKCTYRNDVIASHWITAEEMHEAWDEPCQGPDVIRDYLNTL